MPRWPVGLMRSCFEKKRGGGGLHAESERVIGSHAFVFVDVGEWFRRADKCRIEV
jgi:hypothetical protein